MKQLQDFLLTKSIVGLDDSYVDVHSHLLVDTIISNVENAFNRLLIIKVYMIHSYDGYSTTTIKWHIDLFME